MASDVDITVYNETNDFENIVIFQQEDQLNQMFDNLFPIAWKVFPLNGVEPGEIRKGSTVYPVAQSIGVVRTSQPKDPLTFGKLEITKAADNGERFKYFIETTGALEIDKLDDQHNDDSSISCLNESNEITSIAFAKNGSTLVVQENVAKGDVASFKLTPKIYLMYLNNIKEGDIFKSMQSGAHVIEVDLTGYTSIVAKLKYTGGPGQEKGWIINKS